MDYENICFHGIPHSIVSDNGPQLVSSEFKQFCAINGQSLVKQPQIPTPIEKPSASFKRTVHANNPKALKFAASQLQISSYHILQNNTALLVSS